MGECCFNIGLYLHPPFALLRHYEVLWSHSGACFHLQVETLLDWSVLHQGLLWIFFFSPSHSKQTVFSNAAPSCCVSHSLLLCTLRWWMLSFSSTPLCCCPQIQYWPLFLILDLIERIVQSFRLLLFFFSLLCSPSNSDSWFYHLLCSMVKALKQIMSTPLFVIWAYQLQPMTFYIYIYIKCIFCSEVLCNMNGFFILNWKRTPTWVYENARSIKFAVYSVFSQVLFIKSYNRVFFLYFLPLSADFHLLLHCYCSLADRNSRCDEAGHGRAASVWKKAWAEEKSLHLWKSSAEVTYLQCVCAFPAEA